MKKAASIIFETVGAMIILWVVVSTIQVDRHNMTDQKYSKWNFWEVIVNVGGTIDNEYHEIPERSVGHAPLKKKRKKIRNNVKSLGKFTITAYCGCAKCCGKATGITATGTHATEGRTIAVDPRKIPYGTKVIIDGKTYIAEDCGGAIKGNKIDLYFESHSDALEYGVQTEEVFIKKPRKQQKGGIKMNYTAKEEGIKTRERMLVAIVEYIKQNGYPPTQRELGEIVGVKSTATINYQLLAMEREGMIELGPLGSPRAIKVPGYHYMSDEEIEEIRRRP